MTLTSRSIGWLDHNRRRSYPVERDEWRKKVSPESGLDCVLLDAVLLDADSSGDERLEVLSINVSQDKTVVCMRYGENRFSVDVLDGEESETGDIVVKKGYVAGTGSRAACVSLVFSSHRRILDSAGEGSWTIGARILRSRVVTLSKGSGVDGILANGSSGVDGHEMASTASGDVVLEDGYRTSPIVFDGNVLVRTGKRFGYDPCKFDFGKDGSVDCRRPLFFFCGQNAINGGNIVLKGGKGITVSQGRSYSVRSGTCAGKTIPCVEIIAGSELLDIFKPYKDPSNQEN